MRRAIWTFILLAAAAGAAGQAPISDPLAELRAKAAAGDAEAQASLGIAYETGKGVRQDEWEAAKWYRIAAEQGNSEAQNRLGVLYVRGRGVNRDLEQAVAWYRKAAANGHAAAMFNLGAAYYNGEGVKIDDTVACVWMTLAAEAGNSAGLSAVERMRTEYSAERQAKCAMRVAEVYDKGVQVPTNTERAAKTYRLAAENGDADAQFRLALMYRDGRGVVRDLAEAAKWRASAIKQDHSPAMFYMGAALELGEGVPVDLKEAAKWYERAARKGHILAMERLADMYAQGRGVRPDNVRAYSWLLWAAISGKRVNGFSELQGRMKEKDVKKAEKLLTSLNPTWYQRMYSQLSSPECETRPLDFSLWKSEMKRLMLAHVTTSETGAVKDVLLLRSSGDQNFDMEFLRKVRAAKFVPRPGCGDLEVALLVAPKPKQ